MTDADGPAEATAGTETDPFADYGRALGELSKLINEDNGSYWRADLVGDVLIYNGTYQAGAGPDAFPLGGRTIVITDAATVRAEQLNADGAPVWRTSGSLGDVVERLRELPHPWDVNAPKTVLPEAGGHAPGDL